MGAVAMKQPGIALNEVEAKRLAVAVQQVQAQYPLVIDAKTQAWLNLAAIGGMIYVPRIIAIANVAKANKQQRASPPVQAEQPKAVEDVSTGPILAPDPKGPLTPSQLFGSAYSGG